MACILIWSSAVRVHDSQAYDCLQSVSTHDDRLKSSLRQPASSVYSFPMSVFFLSVHILYVCLLPVCTNFLRLSSSCVYSFCTLCLRHAYTHSLPSVFFLCVLILYSLSSSCVYSFSTLSLLPVCTHFSTLCLSPLCTHFYVSLPPVCTHSLLSVFFLCVVILYSLSSSCIY